MDAHGVLARPSTENCADIYNRAQHVLIGVSPFNSKFSSDYIRSLVAWACARFDRFDILLAGDEAALLLEAVGTPQGRSLYKTRKAVRRNQRAAESAFSEVGVTEESARILRVSDFADDPAYRAARDAAEVEFDTDPAFRSACLDMAEKAVRGRLDTVGGASAVPDARPGQHAVRYVLAEVPFLAQGPSILGVDESVVAYHRPWPLFERMLAGEFALAVHPAQGYVNLTEPPDTGPPR